MKRFLIGALIVLAAGGACVTIVAAKYQPVIRPNTMIGPVPVGGLTKQAAEKQVRWWWETVRTQKLTLSCSLFSKPLPPMTPGQLGITIDDVASVSPVEVNDFWDAASQKISGDPPRKALAIIYKSNGVKADELVKKIKAAIGQERPASVTFEHGVIQRKPEITSYTLDEDKLPDAVTEALQGDGEVVVPVKEAAKHIPDSELAKITDVVSQYSSHFPAYQTSRNTNIRLASAKLNGRILMPGDTLSFNQTVGQRTVQDGFRTAPVLRNGKHDVGIGGGICQVSGTFYNATLLGDVKIVTRHNHSTPSTYLPVGRDATVDWPDLDFVIQNPGPDPVAISSTFESGTLTFRILGKKIAGKTVKIETSDYRTWGGREQTIHDPSMPVGREKVMERGSPARSIYVVRVVYKDGQVVKRESLGTSIYSGLIRVVAVGTGKVAPKAPIAGPEPTAPATPTPTPFPTEIPPPTDGG